MTAPRVWDAAGLSQREWEWHSVDMRLRIAAAPYMDGTWSYGGPRVLWELPAAMHVRSLESGKHRINCSTLTTSLLTAVFPSAPWTVQEYGDLQVFADRLPATDSPVQAVQRMQIGAIVNGFVDGRWHVVQGVRRGPDHNRGFSGHALLARSDGARVQVIESTSLSNHGPRYRLTTAAELWNEFPSALHLAALVGP